MYNFHYEIERRERREFIERNIGLGETIATVKYKGKSSDRIRINTLSDTGIITVYETNWRIVTVHIANYDQACIIYKKAHHEEAPTWLKERFRTAMQWKQYEP